MAEIPHTTIVTCRKCGAEKPVDGFRPNRRTCRECERVAARANYYAHLKEPGLIAAKLRQARANDPERYRLYDKKNAEKNKGAGSDYHKRRYARLDKEKANRLLAEWKNANPEKRRAMEARHRAKYPEKQPNACGVGCGTIQRPPPHPEIAGAPEKSGHPAPSRKMTFGVY